MMNERISQLFSDSIETARMAWEHLAERIEQAASMILEAYRGNGGVFVFGNGGSAADAQHFAAEMVGRCVRERRGLKAQALTVNTSILTAISNDDSFESVFARQLEANASANDVALGLSTSGNSPNVVCALAKAREIGMKTIALTGRGGGRCAEFADILLDVPSDNTPRVQEVHMIVYHAICEIVEAAIADDAIDGIEEEPSE
jgi:D-sedoheptulose 7-phosphate isomerase